MNISVGVAIVLTTTIVQIGSLEEGDHIATSLQQSDNSCNLCHYSLKCIIRLNSNGRTGRVGVVKPDNNGGDGAIESTSNIVFYPVLLQSLGPIRAEANSPGNA